VILAEPEFTKNASYCGFSLSQIFTNTCSESVILAVNKAKMLSFEGLLYWPVNENGMSEKCHSLYPEAVI